MMRLFRRHRVVDKDKSSVLASGEGSSGLIDKSQVRSFGNASSQKGPGFADLSKNSPRHHWFWGPFFKHRWIYLQVAVAAAVTNVFALSTSLFTMTVYDRVIPNAAIESLMALSVGIGIVLGFDFVIKMLRATFIDRAGERVDYEIARQLFDQILNIALSARKGSSGSLSSSVREFETLRDFFTSATFVAVVDLPFVFLFLFVIWGIGGWIAIIPALAVPLVLAVGLLSQPFLSRYSQQSHRVGQTKQSVLVEAAQGLETIKTAGAGPLMMRRWARSVIDSSKIGKRTRFVSQLAMNTAAIAQQSAQVGVVILGVFLVTNGAITVGALIASVILTGRTLAPLAQLANILTRLNHARAAYRGLHQLMAAERDADPTRSYLRREKIEGAIEFRNVIFRYPDQPVRVLDELSFRIQPGERVGILGRVGSGKSTLARLAMGLYQPDDGSILIDNTEIRQIYPDDLRRQVGAVLQDVWLFSGSIRDNLVVGKEDATDAQVLQAAVASGLHEIVGQVPSGYDLQLSERGEGLSGGQKQAIAIARALLKEPSVLIMDEPTSAMDVNSERQFIQHMKKIVPGRTVLLVTHRTSMLELVDRLIIMDRGKIIADGPKHSVLGRLNSSSRNPQQAVG